MEPFYLEETAANPNSPAFHDNWERPVAEKQGGRASG